MKDIEIEQIFLAALEQQHGIVVNTNDPEMLKRKCYSVRNKMRERGDTIYDKLSFRTSPVNSSTELWIFVGDKTNAEN